MEERENGNQQVTSKFVFMYVCSVTLKCTVTDAKSLTP